MSMITIQIGQCGNQIGEKLFETFINDCNSFSYVHASSRFKQQHISSVDLRNNENYVSQVKERFFTEIDNKLNEVVLAPRAVLVDMESKVTKIVKYLLKSNILV
jgi:hypothetical protein